MTIQTSTCKSIMTIAIAAATALALLATPATSARAAEQVKIGYLDLNRVLQAVAKQMPEYDEYAAELEKKSAEIERRRAEIGQIEEELKANRVIWSESKSGEQEKLIQDKVDDLRVFSESAQRYLEAQEKKVLRRVKPEIGKTIRKIGERDGYSMIFEKNILLYRSPNFDITDDIIKEMSENREE